ncbi:MAG: bifunctional tetrahydrofolate synthase/dihydrofolate synthase [Motiliproteus sp.]
MSAAQPATLAQWLSRIEALHPAEIELGLDRVRTVADQLQLIGGWQCPIVTLSGTNGKGSTQAYLSAMLAAQGYRVAAYSSPHLLRYNERIRLNDQPASDSLLCQAFSAIDQACQQTTISLTYFEYATLAGLWLSRYWQPDVMLLEVGLGGRLDAVNIIDADIAVITTVALDHQDWLGNDRETVGVEKAGILRSGRPVVYGEPDMPASVAAQIQALGCPLYHWGTDFGPQSIDNDWCWQGLGADRQPVTYPALPQPLLPFENASTAIQTIELLPLAVSDSSIRRGLEQARLAGRYQCVELEQRQLILDVAHNPHAAAHLVNRLPAVAGKTWCVLGMLQDKDCQATMACLVPAVDRWLFSDLDVARGCSAEQLKSLYLANSNDAPVVGSFEAPWQACQAAQQQSQPGDRILIVGSFFTVADVLARLEAETEEVS